MPNNYSHILSIKLEGELRGIIYDMINNKKIEKVIRNTRIPMRWRHVKSENGVETYYTDVEGMIGDVAVEEHTRQLIADIREIKGISKVEYELRKPLTEAVCML